MADKIFYSEFLGWMHMLMSKLTAESRDNGKKKDPPKWVFTVFV